MRVVRVYLRYRPSAGAFVRTDVDVLVDDRNPTGDDVSVALDNHYGPGRYEIERSIDGPNLPTPLILDTFYRGHR